MRRFPIRDMRARAIEALPDRVLEALERLAWRLPFGRATMDLRLDLAAERISRQLRAFGIFVHVRGGR